MLTISILVKCLIVLVDLQAVFFSMLSIFLCCFHKVNCNIYFIKILGYQVENWGTLDNGSATTLSWCETLKNQRCLIVLFLQSQIFKLFYSLQLISKYILFYIKKKKFWMVQLDLESRSMGVLCEGCRWLIFLLFML